MSTDHPLELNRAVPGGRVEMFDVRGDGYSGGWFYRFQYYHLDEGERLRCDTAHVDEELGWHHRHVASGESTEIRFQNHRLARGPLPERDRRADRRRRNP